MAIKLACKDYDDIILNGQLSATAETGELILASDLGGQLNAFVAFNDIADSASVKGTLIAKAKRVWVDKTTSIAFVPGERVYYSTSTKKATKTTSDVFIGYAYKAAASADTEMWCSFDGSLEAEHITRHAALTFAGLADVNVAGVDDNDTLKFVQSTGKWTKVAV